MTETCKAEFLIYMHLEIVKNVYKIFSVLVNKMHTQGHPEILL